MSNKNNQYYHHKLGGFTAKLRKIMNENPSLPLVIPPGIDFKYGNVDCCVAYVYDQNGDFCEKIITIRGYGSINESPKWIEDCDVDTPF